MKPWKIDCYTGELRESDEGGSSSVNISINGLVPDKNGAFTVTAADVGAEAAGTVATHNVAADAHNARFASKADLVGGKIPAAQLPSYVDDVLEFANLAAFPASGETGKIYVVLDTNKTYRWGGTEYIEISASLALGETAATAFPGDRGKAIETALPNKVDKVAGKGLSSNDYTTDEKNKLAGLSNYDDTELSGRVTALEDSGGNTATVDEATLTVYSMIF